MSEGLASSVPQLTLRLPAATPERRRVARALLEAGAGAAGGTVEDMPDAVLLRGAEAGRARRLHALLDRVWGEAALMPDAGATPLPPAPGLAGLDAWLDGLDPAAMAQRRQGWRLTPDGLRPAFLRLEVARDRLRDAMGVLGGDADLLGHATARLAARLLAALTQTRHRRVLLGAGPVGRLHLALPPGFAGEVPGGVVVTVPLSAAADPDALMARRAALAAGGSALEVEGLDAAALALVRPAAIPADYLRVLWAPGLALDPVDPARVVLAGADAAAARALGVELVETAA